MIALVYAQTRDAQAAMDRTKDFVLAHRNKFEKAAKRLVEKAKRNGSSVEEIMALEDAITGAQHYSTGNITWGCV